MTSTPITPPPSHDPAPHFVQPKPDPATLQHPATNPLPSDYSKLMMMAQIQFSDGQVYAMDAMRLAAFKMLADNAAEIAAGNAQIAREDGFLP